MQLLSLKSVIQSVMAQAERQKNLHERQLFYLHTCQVLTFLLDAPGESSPGWPKAALALLAASQGERQSGPLAASAAFSLASHQRSRPLVEVIAPSPLSEIHEYLLALLELPDIVTIGSLSDIQTAIEGAISVGAPRYNRGDIAGCARLYLVTALTLINAQISRGFPGQARILDTLKKGLVEAQMLGDADERAWALRHAFDRVLK